MRASPAISSAPRDIRDKADAVLACETMCGGVQFEDAPRGDGLVTAGAITKERFADCFRAAYPVLLSIAVGLTGNRADAEDVVQDAVVVGFRKRADYEDGTNFVAWMAAIVRNVGLNDRRKRRRREALPFEEGQSAARETEPGLPVDPRTGEVRPGQDAFDDRVQDALFQLTPVARACLLLRTIHDLDYQTIAEMLEIPKNTALSHVHRARQTLRKHLTETDANRADRGGTHE